MKIILNNIFLNKGKQTKRLLAMKLTVLVCILAAFNVSANVYSQDKILDIDVNNIRIRDLLREIEEKSEYAFFFNDQYSELNTKVSMNSKHEKLENVLNELFKNSNLAYKILENKFVVIVPKQTLKEERLLQGITISGTVTDNDSEPIPGVNVFLKGTTEGTITDANGTYNILIPDNVENATLVFSFIGYLKEEIEVGDKTTIDVILIEDLVGLDEVVVIGYGTIKKRNITGAIAQINPDNLVERPIQRVDQALLGQMAGIRVKQTSGLPGKAFSVQIRGTGSIGAINEPLYVIDGFPLERSIQSESGNYDTGNPLDNINPNDIESIQVLKDASAAAIYGSRAANGVVLITTKKGRTGSAVIGFNMYTGWNETSKKLDVLTGEEWVERATEMINARYLANDPGDQNRQITDDRATREANIGSFDKNQILDDRWAMPGHPGLIYYNYQDEAFRKGPVQNYQLTANGGNEILKYYISGDYLNQVGFILGVDYERYSARANVEMKASNKLKVGINIAPSYSIANDPGVESKDQQMHLIAGHTPVSEDTVGLDMNTGDYPRYTWGTSRNSPIRVLENSIGKAKIFRTLTTIFADYKLLTGLNFKTTFNLDNADQNKKSYKPAWVSGNPGSRQASGSFSGYRRQTFANENTMSYNKTIANFHNISVLGGISYSVNNYNSFRITSTGGFGTEYITTLSDASGINADKTDTKETKSVLLSYFGRVQYNFKEKYLLSGSIRRDGSSRFGIDTKWGIFPSFSAGWFISEEEFLDNNAIINNLKLRTSWGISGNEGLENDYPHIATLESSNYSFGGNLAVGYSPDNFPNPDLSWEECETFDIGLDFGILDNRIFGSLDYYTKTNRDLLLWIPVPSATGFLNSSDEAVALTNIGEVLNKGWETELTGRILTGTFQWTTSVNFSHNQNEVKKLGPDNAPILGGSFDIEHNILTVGEPMYSINVVEQDGLLTQADIDAGAALYGNQEEGDPKYVDYDGDGVITPDDRQIMGHPNPDYIWGINNTFTFKGFDLNILLQGQHGGYLYSIFGRAVNRTGTGFTDNVLGTWADRWRSPEDPGAGKVGKTVSSFGRIKNTDWMYPNDYWRVRNITLGYNLGNVIKKGIIRSARIYATAENWFGKDKYEGGWNPEAVNTKGEDYGATPLPRSMIFGFNLTF